jgi:hypothetical protein
MTEEWDISSSPGNARSQGKFQHYERDDGADEQQPDDSKLPDRAAVGDRQRAAGAVRTYTASIPDKSPPAAR